MSKSAESAGSKKEPFKFDRKEVFDLLRSKGSLEAVSGFADDVEDMLKYAKHLPAKPTDAFLYKELEKIRKNTDVLLKSLRKHSFDLDFHLKSKTVRPNIDMLNLVVESRPLLRQEKGSLITTKEWRRFQFLHTNYPGPLFDSLNELLDAVNHAKKIVYVPSGTSPNGNPEYKRKRALAENFVTFYYRRFNRYPPVTAGGPAIQVFDRLISATGMSEKDHMHYIRNAIDDCKDRSFHIYWRDLQNSNNQSN